MTEEEFLSGERLIVIDNLGFEWTIGTGTIDMTIHNRKQKLKKLDGMA